MKKFKFKIHGIEWVVRFEKLEKLRKLLNEIDPNNDEHEGFVSYKQALIVINDELDDKQKLFALFHEMTHVFLFPNVGSDIYNSVGGIDMELACNLTSISLLELCSQNILKFKHEDNQKKSKEVDNKKA